MNQRIIFRTAEGGVAIIVPAPECLETHTIDEIARKDVPEGLPYKIVDASDIPTDRTFRNAWTIDESELTDGIGAPGQEFTD